MTRFSTADWETGTPSLAPPGQFQIEFLVRPPSQLEIDAVETHELLLETYEF